MTVTSLADIQPAQAQRYQQIAQAKLQLYLTGETHRLMIEAGETMRKQIIEVAGDKLDSLTGSSLQRALTATDQTWATTFTTWQQALETWREVAAGLPFGTLAIYQEWVRAAVDRLQEAHELPLQGVFNPQQQAVMDAANQHLYTDGARLSDRVWQLNQAARAGIQRTLYAGAGQGASAWDTAALLEQYLGASQGCPRWTRTRLYQLSKKEIAGGRRTGLKSGAECRGQGVAYRALRLARNETQIIHHLATDAVMQASPFVLEEQINLSAGHPEPDICDTVVTGGREGRGIYRVGQISLPLHVQCLCYKTAVLMSQTELTSKLRGWLDGSQGWPQMDGYSKLIGGNAAASMLKIQQAQDLQAWIFDNPHDFMN